MVAVAAKIGCAACTLYGRVKKDEVDGGARAGVSSNIADRMRALERETAELRQANEVPSLPWG